MKLTALMVCGLLAGCDRRPTPTVPDTPGAKLEVAAISAGLVTDAGRAALTGSYARDTDRLCVVPGSGRVNRIGAVIDFGDGQACAGSGEVIRSGEKLDIEFGACRFVARFEGDQIVFPAEMPSACDSLCAGRASFAALDVARQSDSASEAAMLRGPGGQMMCGSAG